MLHQGSDHGKWQPPLLITNSIEMRLTGREYSLLHVLRDISVGSKVPSFIDFDRDWQPSLEKSIVHKVILR